MSTAKAAGVVVSSVYPSSAGAPSDRRWITCSWFAVWPALSGVLRRLADRIQAKLAFHDTRRFQALVRQAFDHAGQTVTGPAVYQRLRKLDPNGLGVWYLANGGPQPRLNELCRKAIALPGLGPPRCVARALDRAWSGESACFFGESSGFDALMAASLISAGQAATLVALHLVWSDVTPSLLHAANHLTRTASAVQSAGRAYDRVIGRSLSPAQETTRWIFQAVNLLRRALNHTDLLAVDEQIARESAREALASAGTACAAALQLSAESYSTGTAGETAAARDKLAALARTLDALASRVSAALRSESPSLPTQNFLVEQSGRLLADVAKCMRPWHIALPCASVTADSAEIQSLCARANDLAEASAEVLESWAVLHELWSAHANLCAASTNSTLQKTPDWAKRLVRAVAGTWSCHDILQSLRNVAGKTEQAVAAAVELSVVRSGSLQLRCELWKLIRTSRSAALERSLAFQMFCRMEQC